MEAKEHLSASHGDVLRGCLFADEKQLVRDAGSGTPGLVGEYGKRIILELYASYTREGAQMQVSGFVQFFSDATLVRTHAPCDDFGRPPDSVLRRLSPLAILQEVVLPVRAPKEAVAAWESDQGVPINFAQFFALLLRLSAAVYPHPHREAPVTTFDEFLHEVVVPLHAWRCVHGAPSRGYDAVVAMLLRAFAPNLWRLWCLYATDSHGRPPAAELSYPRDAQSMEHDFARRALPSLWPGDLVQPPHLQVTPAEACPPMCTLHEPKLLQLFCDFSVVPDLLSRPALLALCRQVRMARSRKRPPLPLTPPPPPPPPLPASSRGNNSATAAAGLRESNGFNALDTSSEGRRDASPLATPNHDCARETTKFVRRNGANGNGNFNLKGGKPVHSPPRLGFGASTRTVAAATAAAAAAVEALLGLSFCEFCDVVVKVAVSGLRREGLAHLYPGDFAKVAAVLSVWGLADPARLEEARFLHSLAGPLPVNT